MRICQKCGEEIIGGRPKARFCGKCQMVVRQACNAAWRKRNPRTEYFKQYHMDRREERNTRSLAYMATIPREKLSAAKKRWWASNAYVIKIKRSLGLKSLKKARKLIENVKTDGDRQ